MTPNKLGDSTVAVEQQIAALQERGFCVLKAHLPLPSIENCRRAFWPVLLNHLSHNKEIPNRGPHRHFLPMPFDPPCFTPEFFFDPDILRILQGTMDERIVADQWSCDAPLKGSEYQMIHADYQQPLFPETPDLPLPTYILAVSFGLIDITAEHGPIEIAPGTHRQPKTEALRAIQSSAIPLEPVPLQLGDVLIRHPWALHRGTPNTTGTPRALLTIRYVRRWYTDLSRQVNTMPLAVWQSLTEEQRSMLRFPVADTLTKLPQRNRKSID